VNFADIAVDHYFPGTYLFDFLPIFVDNLFIFCRSHEHCAVNGVALTTEICDDAGVRVAEKPNGITTRSLME
jgi:hypothetical protein